MLTSTCECRYNSQRIWFVLHKFCSTCTLINCNAFLWFGFGQAQIDAPATTLNTWTELSSISSLVYFQTKGKMHGSLTGHAIVVTVHVHSHGTGRGSMLDEKYLLRHKYEAVFAAHMIYGRCHSAHCIYSRAESSNLNFWAFSFAGDTSPHGEISSSVWY